MKSQNLSHTFCLMICLLTTLTHVFGQDAAPVPVPPVEQDEEVVNINTELVQTDVTVLDKKGQFVRDLRVEDFELKIDGRVQPITFFELVTSVPGTRERQRNARTTSPSATVAAPAGVERGRTLLFFVDNIHIAPDTMARTRKMLTKMIEDEVGINDQAMISATFNQIGFLQQLTGNQAVLRAAVKRLVSRNFSSLDTERPPMTDYNAFKIIDLNDVNLFEYFVDEYIRLYGVDRPLAEDSVRVRAEQKLAQAAASAENTLSTLERVVRSLNPLPGRKVLFFISDGFLLQTQQSDINVRLRRVTDAAARNNTVIYSLDAKGLATDPFFDASRSNSDSRSVLLSASMGEISAGQDPLYTLAADTGGRALFNNNDLGAQVTRALDESSTYYLLAWTPAVEEQRGGKFRRLEVRVKDRRDLKILVRKGFFNGAPPQLAKEKHKAVADPQPATSKANTPDAKLRSAIESLYPSRALPVALSAGFVDAPGAGFVLLSTVGLDRSALTASANGGAREVDIVQVLYNDDGKVIASIKQQLGIAPRETDSSDESPLVFQHTFPLTPGLYQLRVAVRDRQSERIGSAFEWIEVPDIKAGVFALGSVFVGGRVPASSPPVHQTPTLLIGEPAIATPALPPPSSITDATISTSADHHFTSNSQLRFLTTVYNPTLRDSASDVLLRVQVLRNGRTLITSATRKLTPNRVAPTRISYAAGFPLTGLPRGQYLLVLIAEDQLARKSSEQKIKFYIE